MQYPVGERPHPHLAFGFWLFGHVMSPLYKTRFRLIFCASSEMSKLEQLNVPLGHIPNHYLSLVVVVVTLTVAGKDTFRGYLMGLGFQGRESLF